MKTIQVLDHGHMRRFWSTADMPSAAYKPGAGASLNAESIADGMVLALLFNEGTGDETADLSAGTLTGSITSSALWDTDDKYGSHLNFDGSNHIEFPHDAKNNIETFTFAFAIKTAHTTPYKALFSKGSGFSSYPYEAYFSYPTSGKIALEVYDGGTTVNTSTSTTHNDGDWHKVVFTKSKGGKIRIYVDGVLRSEADDTTSDTTSTGTLYVGATRFGDGQFIGRMGHLHMWNRVLSGAPGSVGDAATGEIAALNTDEFLMYR